MVATAQNELLKNTAPIVNKKQGKELQKYLNKIFILSIQHSMSSYDQQYRL